MAELKSGISDSLTIDCDIGGWLAADMYNDLRFIFADTFYLENQGTREDYPGPSTVEIMSSRVLPELKNTGTITAYTGTGKITNLGKTTDDYTSVLKVVNTPKGEIRIGVDTEVKIFTKNNDSTDLDTQKFTMNYNSTDNVVEFYFS